MKKLVGVVLATMVIPLFAHAGGVDEHNFIRGDWSSLSENGNIGNTTYKMIGYSLGITAEISFKGLAYIGGSYSPSTPLLMELANTTDYVDGTATGLSIYVGAEKDVGGVLVFGELHQNSANVDVTYHATFGADTTSNTTSSGLSGVFGLILPLVDGRITGKVDMGLSGDYSNSPTEYGVVYRSRFSDKGFSELGYSTYSDVDQSGSVFGGSFGYYF